MHQKVISSADAVSVIRDGDTVLVSGFVGIGTPDELILCLLYTSPSPRDRG